MADWTIEEVRHRIRMSVTQSHEAEALAGLDRWLATHDTQVAREAAEKALRDFADDFRPGDESHPWTRHVRTCARARADRLAGGEQS